MRRGCLHSIVCRNVSEPSGLDSYDFVFGGFTLAEFKRAADEKSDRRLYTNGYFVLFSDKERIGVLHNAELFVESECHTVRCARRLWGLCGGSVRYRLALVCFVAAIALW
jgi:hypothetical protein